MPDAHNTTQMRSWLAVLATLALGASGAGVSGQAPAAPRPMPSHQQAPAAPAAAAPAAATNIESAQTLVKSTCIGCHSDRTRSGGLSLQSFDVQTAGEHAETAEKMIRKLRAGQMPPPGSRRPAEAALDGLADVLEREADAHAADVVPGRRTFQRLNRAEYHELGARPARARRQRRRLPAARHEERELRQHRRRAAAVADLDAGLPDGGRGNQPPRGRRRRGDAARGDLPGVAVDLAAGACRGRAVRHARRRLGRRTRSRRTASTASACPSTTRPPARCTATAAPRCTPHEAPEQVEISIDGARVALLDIDRWMSTSDPDGVNLRTEPIAITAGPHRVSAAFIRRFEGPAQDLISPLDWSIASTSIADAYGIHDAAAPARHGDHRAVRGHRRVGDAEPPQDLHLPAGDRAAADGVRARDRRPRWRRRRSAARWPSAISTR